MRITYGPMNTVAENTATANPRTSLLNMSANTAATMARGEDPQRPAKKRQIITVWISLATATAMVKIEKPKAAMTSGGRRPYSSEIGAHMTAASVSECSSSEVVTKPILTRSKSISKYEQTRTQGTNLSANPKFGSNRTSGAGKDGRAHRGTQRIESQHDAHSQFLLCRPVLRVQWVIMTIELDNVLLAIWERRREGLACA
jgi:hypothetical protein